MTWLFEWNWLGYLWAILVGGPLAMATLFAYPEGKGIEQGKQGAGHFSGLMMFLVIPGMFLLGLLTIFVWDWRTALWLTGGALAWDALIAGLLFLGSLLERWKSR